MIIKTFCKATQPQTFLKARVLDFLRKNFDSFKFSPEQIINDIDLNNSQKLNENYSFFSALMTIEIIPLDIFYFLVNSHSQIFKKDNGGRTPFHLACRYNTNLEIIKYLVDQKKCDLKEKDNFGETPFHLACQYNTNLEIIKYLVDQRVGWCRK